MTILEWGALGEMIGGVAVVISLVYVGSQIRQNTKATKSRASQAFVDVLKMSIDPLMREPEFRELYRRGLSGLDNLKGAEIVGFTVWVMITMRSWESFYYQHKEGVFEDHLMEGWISQYRDMFGYKGCQEVWTLRRHQFSEDFRNYAEMELKKERAHALYPSVDGIK